MGFWDGKKVLVTGGAGFIGSHVVEALLSRAPSARVTVTDSFVAGKRRNLFAVRERVRVVKTDLRDLDNCHQVCKGQDVVLNLAARVGGIGYNVAHPGTMFRDNMRLGLNMLEAARRSAVERFLVVSSACVYPRLCVIPTPESAGFSGAPEQTNEGYGWAKRMAEYQARAYHQEFGMKTAIVRPYNAYGPRDHFEPATSHVIAALVRRVVKGESPLRVWGDGRQTRSFLFVEDLARGLLDVTERYAACDPVNLGTKEEVSIRALAGMILRAAGSTAKLRFDRSKPSGQPRRAGQYSKARVKAGFTPRVGLEEGLRRTVAWYREHR